MQHKLPHAPTYMADTAEYRLAKFKAEAGGLHGNAGSTFLLLVHGAVFDD